MQYRPYYLEINGKGAVVWYVDFPGVGKQRRFRQGIRWSTEMPKMNFDRAGWVSFDGEKN